MNDDASQVDPDRRAQLCDVGLPGYSAVIALDTCGCEHAVLVLDSALGDDHVRYDPHCADITHEQLGPLPGLWRDRTRHRNLPIPP